MPQFSQQFHIGRASQSGGGASRDGAPHDGAPLYGAPRVAALDGLRGVAIVAVVAYHAGVLPGGYLGVDLFFVLSGFLITGLLLREQQQTGTIALRHFWTRRARRLVPAVLFLVAMVQIWARTKALPEELSVTNGQSAAAMVYGSNWFNIFFNVGYWSVGPGNSPLNHLWSLAIEEQFYIVFPVLLFVVLVRGKMRPHHLVWFALMLAAASFALTPFVFARLGANRAYFGTDTRVGAILLGGALAAWLHSRTTASRNTSVTTTPEVSARVLSFVAIAAGTGVAMMLMMWSFLSLASPPLYRGGLALHALASVSIIAATVLAPAGRWARLLRWHPLVWLGERSYSLYLWHWPLMVILPHVLISLRGPLLVTVIAVAIMFATLVSYDLVEQPVRYSGLSGARLVTSLSVPAVLIAASALSWQPPPPPQFGSDILVTQGRSGIRLMLVGDSWARKLGVALAAVDSSHRLSILNVGKGGCGIADARRQRTPEKGEFETAYDCLQWHKTWRSTLDAVRPEVAILNVGNWDLAAQDFDGTGEFVGACSAKFAARYAGRLDTAISVLAARGARVFVMTIRDNDAREGSEPDCMNQLLRAAVTRHAPNGVQLLDLYAQLCQDHRCPDVADGEAVYDGTGHLAPKAQQRIATWVLNRVNAEFSKR